MLDTPCSTSSKVSWNNFETWTSWIITWIFSLCLVSTQSNWFTGLNCKGWLQICDSRRHAFSQHAPDWSLTKSYWLLFYCSHFIWLKVALQSFNWCSQINIYWSWMLTMLISNALYFLFLSVWNWYLYSYTCFRSLMSSNTIVFNICLIFWPQTVHVLRLGGHHRLHTINNDVQICLIHLLHWNGFSKAWQTVVCYLLEAEIFHVLGSSQQQTHTTMGTDTSPDSNPPYHSN